MIKINIYANVSVAIEDAISHTFPLLNSKQHSKLIDKTKNLLLFIYTKHTRFLQIYKDKKEVTENSFCPIMNNNFDKYDYEYSRNEKISRSKLMKILVDLKFIEINPHHSTDSDKAFPQGYKPIYKNLVPSDFETLFDETIKYEIPSEFFVNKIKKSKIQYKNEAQSKQLKYVVDITHNAKINMKRLVADMNKEKSNKEIIDNEEHYVLGIGSVLKEEKCFKKVDGCYIETFEDVYLTKKYANNLIIEAEDFNNRNFFFSQADTNRIYYSIAQLNKRLLPYLVINGSDEIDEVDGANFQPLLYNIFYKNDYFYEVTKKGIFYDCLIDLNDEKINTRDKVKALCFNIFYDFRKINSYLRSILDAKFEGLSDSLDNMRVSRERVINPNYREDGTNKKYSSELNPDFIKLLEEGKPTFGCPEYLPNKKYDKKNVKYNIKPDESKRKLEPWFLLQSNEANLFIVKGLETMIHKNIFLAPRHDSYLVEHKNSKDVFNILNYLLKQEYDLEGTFVIKNIQRNRIDKHFEEEIKKQEELLKNIL